MRPVLAWMGWLMDARRRRERARRMMMNPTTERWVVTCDDEREYYRTRAEARARARAWRRHPSVMNIRMFGPYRNATGIVRVERAKDAEQA